MNRAMFTSRTNECSTPLDFFDKLDKEFHFTLDPCATRENAKCKQYYTKEDDGLSKSWAGHTVFCNPPYGKEIKDWVRKAREESKHATVVMLIPARTDTTYWHYDIFGVADEIRYIKGRLKFGDSIGSAPFPSAVVIFKNKRMCDEIDC